MQYDLMHKNIQVLRCDIDYGHIVKILDIIHDKHAPVGTYNKHGISRKDLIAWFERRSIPASRDNIEEVLRRIGVQTTVELLEKSYGLSLSDQYWIKPVGSHLSWENVNFFQNDFSDGFGSLLLEGQGNINSSDFALVSPDNTSDGWLKKKWKIIDGERCLIKAGSDPYHQEPLNELIATELCSRLGIPHIPYNIFYGQTGSPYSVCKDYITPNTELVTAYAMSTLLKQPGHESDYTHYLKTCETFGIRNTGRNMDQMICVDYIMANTDRHWTNFGVVRNADTLEFMEVMPIFDTGTSLWNRTALSMIGKAPIMGKMFQTTLEKHLKHVKDVSFLDFSKLQDFPEFAAHVLQSSAYLQKDRISTIQNMIGTRIRSLDNELAQTKDRVFIQEQTVDRIIASSQDGERSVCKDNDDVV